MNKNVISQARGQKRSYNPTKLPGSRCISSSDVSNITNLRGIISKDSLRHLKFSHTREQKYIFKSV